MPNTISVSPAAPDKLVVNGCDLLNREELSNSQNRELQRYIDANAHLLGFIDKEKEEREAAERQSRYTGAGAGNYGSHSLDRYSGGGGGGGNDAAAPGNGLHSGGGGDDYDKRVTASLNRAGSPSSEYGGKRKGVSWSDTGRGRSHSPPKLSGQDPTQYASHGRAQPTNGGGGGGYGSQRPPAPPRSYSPSYSSSDKRRSPHDHGHGHGRRQDSPWGDTWSRTSRDNERDSAKAASGWKGFGRNDTPAYSTLDRHPDDYNRYETYRHREQLGRQSQERDDIVKFYGYGDHNSSGLELKPKRWTGGEIITDPNFVKRSMKPRRLFYSPIGDGVVAADGVEMKRGPPDLTPRITVRHERYVEQQKGQPGHTVIERLWDEGGGPGDQPAAKALADGRFPLGDLPDSGLGDDGFGPSRGPKRGAGDGDGGWPIGRGGPDSNNNGGPYGASPYEGLDPRGGDDGPRSASALSIGTDGLPREGWTKTFITNPRELINQYALETPTAIFDLEDHTPKTITTIKESISPVP